MLWLVRCGREVEPQVRVPGWTVSLVPCFVAGFCLAPRLQSTVQGRVAYRAETAGDRKAT
jgi:hypothetical protein